jgi:hypothetical protein
LDADAVTADSLARESLAIAVQIGNDVASLWSLGLLSVAAAKQAEERLAGTLWGAAEALDAEVGETIWRRDRLQLEELLGETSAEFEAGREEGRERQLDYVVARAGATVPAAVDEVRATSMRAAP